MFSPGRWSRQGRCYYRRSCRAQPCIVLLSCYCLVVAHSLAFSSSVSRATLSQTHRWGRSTLHECRRLSKSRELQLRPTTKTAGVVMAGARGSCRRTLVVIGGGAAGYFGAVQAASSTSELRVLVLEAGKLPLQKVKISGGGRCNVMHDTSKVQSPCVSLCLWSSSLLFAFAKGATTAVRTLRWPSGTAQATDYSWCTSTAVWTFTGRYSSVACYKRTSCNNSLSIGRATALAL